MITKGTWIKTYNECRRQRKFLKVEKEKWKKKTKYRKEGNIIQQEECQNLEIS